MATKPLNKSKLLTKKESRKHIEELGGADKVRSDLLEYIARVKRMASLRTELLEKHPDMWVALAGGDIIEPANSLKEILAVLDERGISRSEAVIEFLNTKPRTLIL